MNRIETKIIIMITNKLAAAKDCDAKSELIEELSENLYQRYMDLTAAGVSEEEALQQAMDSLGDVNELLEYLAYLSGEDVPGSDSQGDPEFSFNSDKLEKGIEDIVNMAMSAARSAVDVAGTVTRNVSRELKERYPDGFNFEFNGKKWSSGWSENGQEGGESQSGGEDILIPGEQIQSLDVSMLNGDVQLMLSQSGEGLLLEGDTNAVQYVVSEDGVLCIRQNASNNSHGFFGRSNGVRLDITIPDKLWKRVGLQSTSGDVTCEESLRCENFYVGTKSGDVNLEDLTADKMAVRTLSGDVRGTHLAGKLYVNSTSGDVTVEDCDLAACGVISTSGDVRVESRIVELNCSSTSGDVEIDVIEQSPNLIKAATTSGDIRLELSDTEGFTLGYRTVSGDLDYDLDEAQDCIISREGSKKGSIIYRGGQPTQVQISTVSGDIDLRLV